MTTQIRTVGRPIKENRTSCDGVAEVKADNKVIKSEKAMIRENDQLNRR
jgi:hypothetical protein